MKKMLHMRPALYILFIKIFNNEIAMHGFFSNDRELDKIANKHAIPMRKYVF